LEEDGALELLVGIRDLVPGTARRIPFGDDHRCMWNADTEAGVAYLALPDDIAGFQMRSFYRVR
jgi:hypothetical protein